MIPEHMFRLDDLVKKYNQNHNTTLTKFANRQTKYLGEDLDAGNPIEDLISCHEYGNKALDVIERAFKINWITRDRIGKAFEIKHNYNIGYPSKKIDVLPFNHYEDLKEKTINRVMSIYKNR